MRCEEVRRARPSRDLSGLSLAWVFVGHGEQTEKDGRTHRVQKGLKAGRGNMGRVWRVYNAGS